MRESSQSSMTTATTTTTTTAASSSSSSLPSMRNGGMRSRGHAHAPQQYHDPRQQQQQQQSGGGGGGGGTMRREMTIAPSVDRNHPLIRSNPSSANQPQRSKAGRAAPTFTSTSTSTPTLTSTSISGGAQGQRGGEKEEYMSSLQKQRDRVMRIRKAIVAAEVIQRAWRRYRARKHR